MDLDANNSVRPSFTVTYMATRNIGIELLAAWPFEHDIRGSGLGRIASTKQLPPHAQRAMALPAGQHGAAVCRVGLNYTTFFDTKTHGALEGSDLRLGDSWGLAGQLGVDVKLNERWFLNADLRYIDISSKVKLGRPAHRHRPHRSVGRHRGGGLPLLRRPPPGPQGRKA
ncbi:outer membrane protein [Bordetella pertussis]|nr:outer membrane protein [Bordetella pertussis]